MECISELEWVSVFESESQSELELDADESLSMAHDFVGVLATYRKHSQRLWWLHYRSLWSHRTLACLHNSRQTYNPL